MTDLELLRRYEPILRFTRGEIFFPTAIDGYVEQSSLWASATGQSRGRFRRLVAPAGSLDLDRLACARPPDPDQTLSLRFVQAPLTGLAYRRWRHTERPAFQAPGRLARVGLTARFIDALFSLSLLLRGTVPGGTTAAAAQGYRRMLAHRPAPTYYGRVVRQAGYCILHYHFFYVMNDWRSSFAGVNDHEADWEQVVLYLEEQPDAPPCPAWVAFAAHDFAGDDLRRRWDDPDLTLVGTHPVVYVGAGSHAAYVQPGEYLLRVELAFLEPILHAVRAAQRLWRDVLRQGDAEELVSRIESLLRIPFVDYARGDGRSIGPGQADTWSPAPIDDDTAWVDGYRGLWGLDTRDILAGELAPAGPKYTRDGTIRRSWYDPLGWAGLSKVAPTTVAPAALARHLAELEAELVAADDRIAALQDEVRGLDLEVRALRTQAHMHRLHDARAQVLAERESDLRELQARRMELDELAGACRQYEQAPAGGWNGDPRAHLRRAPMPESATSIRRGKLVELWAALSTGVLLLGALVLIVLGLNHKLIALTTLVATVVTVENILHRRVERLLLNLTIGLAFATTLVLVYEFFWPITIAVFACIAGLILIDNLRELRGR